MQLLNVLHMKFVGLLILLRVDAFVVQDESAAVALGLVGSAAVNGQNVMDYCVTCFDDSGHFGISGRIESGCQPFAEWRGSASHVRKVS